VLASTGDGAVLLTTAVFGATISYALMMVSHIVLRRREPGLERPYRTPGGVLTTGVAVVLAASAVVATLLVDEAAALWALGALAALLLWFGLHSRHHLVAAAPEEERERR
jgi:ethanolamine permease